MNAPAEAARIFSAHVQMGGGGGILAQPVEGVFALSSEEMESAIAVAETQALADQIRGGESTPFLLKRLGESTGGRSLPANRELIVANARLAARVALCLTSASLRKRELLEPVSLSTRVNSSRSSSALLKRSAGAFAIILDKTSDSRSMPGS